MFSEDLTKAKELFIEFSGKEDNNVEFIDFDKRPVQKLVGIIGVKAAQEHIEKILTARGVKLDCLGLKGYEEIRKDIIVELKKNSNLSIRQIALVLKINRGMVQRIKA